MSGSSASALVSISESLSIAPGTSWKGPAPEAIPMRRTRAPADRAGGEGERATTREPERGEALHAELVDEPERTVRHARQSERSG